MTNVQDPEAAGGMVLSERAASENNNAGDDSLSEADDNPVVEHHNNYGDDSSSSAIVDSVQGDEKVDEAPPPQKPGMLNWTIEDIHNEIRRKLRYDPGNLFMDDEIDEKGMMAKLGLKTQLEVTEKIDQRKKDAEYQFNLVDFTIKDHRKKYEKELAEYRRLHPEKDQPTVLAKRKKPTQAA